MLRGSGFPDSKLTTINSDCLVTPENLATTATRIPALDRPLVKLSVAALDSRSPFLHCEKRKERASPRPTALLPAVATAAATTATTIPPAATAAKFSGLGLVHLEVTSLEILAIELRNRLGGVAGALHFDEAEASRLAREFV